MIKFFRNIRKSLLTENRVSKYLVYAFGEIVLVVIGILIALQINNWNEDRKQNKLEQDYLKALRKEFKNNLKEVDKVIRINESQLNFAKELADYTGPEQSNISEKKFAKLFFGLANSEVQYRPGTGVTNEILNSGKLNIFKNEELKEALASMDGLLLKIRFQENEELSFVRYELLKLAYSKLGLRRMAFDALGENFGLDKGHFLESNLHVLSSKEFDNWIMGFIFTSGYLDGRYKVLKKQLENIISIIDNQIVS